MTGLGGTPWGGEKKGYSVNFIIISPLCLYIFRQQFIYFHFFFSSFEVVSILLSMIKKIRAGAFCSVLNRLNRPKLV